MDSVHVEAMVHALVHVKTTDHAFLCDTYSKVLIKSVQY